MRALLYLSATVFCLSTTSAFAWWDEGHMQVAAIAYERLTPSVREKVDALIKLNPEYQKWVASYPADRTAQYAFVRAAVWADDIKKSDSGFANDGEESKGKTEAARNIGYHDHLMHKYWHYMDIGFSYDGTTIEPADPVNAVSQIKLLMTGLSTASGLPDSVRSYDLVWLIHLVGDAHQPLHATARFSSTYPHGDQGGNKEKVKPSTGIVTKLHSYWDGLLGSYSTPDGAIWDALTDPTLKLPDPDETLAQDVDPGHWFKESQKLAINFAYAEPVKSGTEPFELDRAYETNAMTTARNQAALAGARLANLINGALK